VGEEFDYTITATNNGPDDEPNAVVHDDLPDELRFVEPHRNCTAEGQKVTCKLGELKAGQKVTGTLRVKVVKLPANGNIHNVATITGDNPNPDCKAPTPKALCNEDPEDTPYTPPATPGVKVPFTSTTLPRTGASVLGLTALGALLIGSGALLMRGRRRAGLALAQETSHPQGFDAQP
jgi:LPXTG-motif cell wall-anchored protein